MRSTPRTSRLYSWGSWLLAGCCLAIALLTSWRVANWDRPAQRPDDLLTTFPLILFLLLSAAGADRGDQPANRLLRFLSVTSIAFGVLVLIVSPVLGGVEWGPRYLLPIVVPLAVVIVAQADRLWQLSSRAARLGTTLAFGGLLLAGGCSTLAGLEFMHRGQVASESLSKLIEASPEKVIVTDAWFIPQVAAYTLGNKIWLLAENEESMFQLIQQLRKTTDEPGMIYISSLTWAHIDPLVLMGLRIAPNGDRQHVDSPTQYLEFGRYFLYK